MTENVATTAWDEPNEELLEAFWVRARTMAKLNPLEVVVGQDDLSSLRPAAFAFGDTPAMASRLCELVISGKKRATSSWVPSYEAEGEELPSKGELSILLDGSGIPRALLRTTQVRVIPFDEVGADVAEAEAEGSFEQWKVEHEDFFKRECEELGIPFDKSQNVVVEYFDVLYKHTV